MIYAIAALSVLALTFFVYGLAYKDVKQQEAEYNAPVQIAGPMPPSIFCETIGCSLMADHPGCCGECDVCAQFGSHDAPIVREIVWSDMPNADYYVGKHIGAAEPNVRGFSGYVGEHRADNHPLYS